MYWIVITRSSLLSWCKYSQVCHTRFLRIIFSKSKKILTQEEDSRFWYVFHCWHKHFCHYVTFFILCQRMLLQDLKICFQPKILLIVFSVKKKSEKSLRNKFSLNQCSRCWWPVWIERSEIVIHIDSHQSKELNSASPVWVLQSSFALHSVWSACESVVDIASRFCVNFYEVIT